MRTFRLLCLAMLLPALLAGCSQARHVPQGETLLDKVSVVADMPDSVPQLETASFVNYIRQQPNHKILWSMKFQLGIYNMSGHDSTKWYNKWVRRMGEAPVVYDSLLTSQSVQQLRRALINLGYLDADVNADIKTDSARRKTAVTYRMSPGQPHTIRSVEYTFADDTLRTLLEDSSLNIIRPGSNLDRNMLDMQREIYTRRLRNHGYFTFSKDLVTFSADTTEGSLLTDLTINVRRPEGKQGSPVSANNIDQYIVRRVYVVTDYNPVRDTDLRALNRTDTVAAGGIDIIYSGKRYLRPNVIVDNCWIRPASPYSQRDMERTYESFGRLGIISFISIKFEPAGAIDHTGLLDAYILLTPGKSQTISIELEGTNSEGDLGVAAGITYTHRNIGHGSETFSTKFRGAYESLSGKLENLINNRYMEYSADIGLTFPKFKCPFLSTGFKRRVRATTELKMSLNYQERPEYTRIIATAGWTYQWSRHGGRLRFGLTPLDVNYVYLPRSTNDFINQIAPDNPLLRYSYEDHFIMRLGGRLYYSTKRRDIPYSPRLQTNVSTVRASVETAGNLLYAINNVFNHRPQAHLHPYKVFGIRYSQYVKLDADYSFSHSIDRRQSIAFHTAFGLAYPYGNSHIVPFEKRFYGGGANGVRGWDVRTLGPGSFRGSNSVADFINQCGDIRFDASFEYRAKLFWVVELGLFADAGNIWTIHNYPNQPGGMFKFNSFYKEIAAAYGIGIRLDFTYFLLRFDLGMKAHNPATGAERWPIIHPHWRRDSSFHFSIGYPF